jgi:type II secretory pathway pseudopilin PulG
MKTMPSLRQQRGFSIIEIIAAFTIAAISLTMLMRVFGQGVVLIDTAQEYSRAVLIAESKLAMVGNEINIEEGGAGGEEGQGRYQWQVQIQPYEVPPPPPPVYANNQAVQPTQATVPIPVLEMKQVTATVTYPKVGIERGKVQLVSFVTVPLP